MPNETEQQLLGLLPRERILKTTFPRPSDKVVESFLDLPDMAGLVSRAMDRLGIVGSIPAHVLSPLSPDRRIVGPAVTVRNVPSRFVPLYGWQESIDTQLGEREAYYIAEPGDVVVIDSGGRFISSNLGPNSSAMAMSQGIIGAVVDGPVTGPAGIRANRFPVWSRGGTTTTGHHRVDTIEINGVVACAAVQVRPGDLIVADDSGISVVPNDRIEEVLEVSRDLEKRGRVLAQAISEDRGIGEAREAFKRLIVEDSGAV